METVTAQSESYTLDCYLQTTPSQEELSRFVELRHRTDDVPVTLPDDGAVITEKMASLLGVEVGDTITLDGESRVTITVADITEHYVQHYIYVSDTYYETLFGEAPTANTVLVDFPWRKAAPGNWSPNWCLWMGCLRLPFSRIRRTPSPPVWRAWTMP